MLWDDMKPRRVVGFNTSNGNALVDDNGNLVELETWAGPNGSTQFKRPEPTPIDQQGEREKKSVRERWAGVGIDQAGAV